MNNEQHTITTSTTGPAPESSDFRNRVITTARVGLITVAALAALGTTIGVTAATAGNDDDNIRDQIELLVEEMPAEEPTTAVVVQPAEGTPDAREQPAPPDLDEPAPASPADVVDTAPELEGPPVEIIEPAEPTVAPTTITDEARSIVGRFEQAMRAGDPSLVADVTTPVAAEVITWWGTVPEGFPEAQANCDHVTACYVSLFGATVQLVLDDTGGDWVIVDAYVAHDGDQVAQVRIDAHDFFAAFVAGDIATMQALAPTTDPYEVGLDRAQETANFWCESDTVCAIHLDVRGYLLHLGDGPAGPIERVQPVGTWVESPTEAFSILQAAVEAGDTWIAQFVSTSNVRDRIDWVSADRSFDITVAADGMSAVWTETDGSTTHLTIVHGAKGGAVIDLAG